MIKLNFPYTPPKKTFLGTEILDSILNKTTAPPPTPPTSFAKVTPLPPQADHAKEAKRRDAIVRELYKKCDYDVGDEVIPVKQPNFQEKITVHSICKTYASMGKKEVWPDSDNPLIVTAYNHTTKQQFICTTNYLQKKATISHEC